MFINFLLIYLIISLVILLIASFNKGAMDTVIELFKKECNSAFEYYLTWFFTIILLPILFIIYLTTGGNDV